MQFDPSYLKATLSPILPYLEDDKVNEVKISHYKDDLGALWLNIGGEWIEAVDKYNQPILIENKKLEQIIGYMAGTNDILAHSKSPIVECAIPILGYRFTGILAPASIGCSKFNIRKFSTTLYTLEDYVKQGMFEDEYIDVIRNWLKMDHFSICVAGSTNSGKTTFLCSLINEKRKIRPNDNWVVIEDTQELTIPAGNVDRLLTTRNVNMDDHLKVTLRLTPDNCVVGEVRGKEASTALELSKIKSLMFTMHAGQSSEQALSRIERMVLQHPDVDKVDRMDIADNINGIISIQNVRYKKENDSGQIVNCVKRQITSIDLINGYDKAYQIYAKTKIK